MLAAEFKTRRLLNLTIFLGTNDEDAKIVKELLTSIGLSGQIPEYQQVQIVIFQKTCSTKFIWDCSTTGYSSISNNCADGINVQAGKFSKVDNCADCNKCKGRKISHSY